MRITANRSRLASVFSVRAGCLHIDQAYASDGLNAKITPIPICRIITKISQYGA